MNIRKNVASLFTFLLLLQVLKKFSAAADPCIFDANPKGIIDFTGIGRKDGTPKWKNEAPTLFDAHVYSYNPCHPFTQGSCKDVAGCQQFTANENLTYSLGSQDSIEWTSNGDEPPTLTYRSERTLIVNLRCLKSGEPDHLEVHGYDGTVQLYIMVLSSKCVCWDGCKGGSSSNPSGLSGGAIFIILLSVLLIVYIITFMTFNRVKRQATGLDILPHRGFWILLPGLAFDGVKFTYYKATGKSGYSSLT